MASMTFLFLLRTSAALSAQYDAVPEDDLDELWLTMVTTRSLDNPRVHGALQPVLHADNYAGHNKNRFVMQYLAWHVLIGLNDIIKLRFMVVGHSKNYCDAHFDLEPKVNWVNWKALLAQYFVNKGISRIAMTHHFEFHASASGVVYLRQSLASDPTCRVQLLKPRLGAAQETIPERIQADMKGFPLVIISLSSIPATKIQSWAAYLAHAMGPCLQVPEQTKAFFENVCLTGNREAYPP
ncbi:uncharacterized protein MONBRDRAFT_9846 [Monosiga brevicollis MX1]|uniref:DUF7869 domain-containing protein n=1 Tax=Monosiga brevicollis TaxID=81824 RepID=A9V4E7_MONBE|nr:uncharacterized protein MONBRDRAFT_9846 [Monosiga brevicollis MX1]EDQ87697.1 predicted protein [Monosiga brevicollis MX1]|eukprot:XP_001747617.1 hypothetical protein [Monosiga brevicollis MX1]